MRFSGFRKIVSVILALTVVSSLFSFAQNGKTVFKYKTCDGKPLTDMEYHSEYSESYDSTTGYYTLTVNKVITTLGWDTLPFEGLDWWSMKKNISEIIIPEGIRVIHGFLSDSQVEKVTLPESLEEIGEDSFYECQKLQSISIPKNVKTIGHSAFYDCYSLNSVDFAMNAELNDLEGLCFAGCHSLKSVSLPSKIDVIPYGAFWGCHSLVSIKLPKKLKVICESAFQGCGSLEHVSLPNKLERIDVSAFTLCDKLESIKIPQSVNDISSGAFRKGCIRKFSGKFASKDGTYLSDKDTLIAVNDEWILKGAVPDGISDIGLAYSWSNKLRQIEIPSSVKSIPWDAFISCDSLESVMISESVTEIGIEAFRECKSLKRINLPQNLKSIEYATFFGCESLEELVLPDSITEINNSAFSGCKSLKRINLPASITKIAYEVFSSCESLKTITLPDNLTAIGGYAFSSCKSLERITLPDSISEIGEKAFAGCKSLKRINLPGKLTSLGKSTFAYCKSLEELALPDSITEIGEEAFRGCKSLKRINLPQNLKSIENCTFYECESLEELVLPDSITEIKAWTFVGCNTLKKITLPKNLKIIGKEAFKNCTSLEELSLPDSITEIGQGAFQGCTSLKKINIPSSLSEIPAYCFNNHTQLTEVRFSEGLKTIGEKAFSNTGLIEITLPVSLKEIGKEAFSMCHSLETIYINNPNTIFGYRAFANSENLAFITGDYDYDALDKAQANYGTKSKAFHERMKEIGRQQEAERREREKREACVAVYDKYYDELKNANETENYKKTYELCLKILNESNFLYLQFDSYPRVFEYVLYLRSKSYSEICFPDGLKDEDIGAYYRAMRAEAETLTDYSEQMCRRWPNNSDGYFYAGLGYAIQGKIDSAKKNFLKCIELDKDNACVGYRNIGVVYFNNNNYSEAIKWYKSALKEASSQKERDEITQLIIKTQKKM